ncbi:MAG: CBS domain-containing protein [Anaerolineales bacterium]
MNTVRHLLELRGGFTWTIDPQSSVYEALRLMSDKDVGALPVVQDDKVVGLISERDYARKIILRGRSSKDTPVQDIMETDFPVVHPDQTVEECMELMTKRRCRHLVVMENERMIGIISIGDVVRCIIYSQRQKLSQLEGMTLATQFLVL